MHVFIVNIRSLIHAHLCVATDLLLLYQILHNTPTLSRKNKILSQNFTTGVAHKSANRCMRYFSNISVAVLGIAEDYFSENI